MAAPCYIRATARRAIDRRAKGGRAKGGRAKGGKVPPRAVVADQQLALEQRQQRQAVIAVEEFAHADPDVVAMHADARALPGVALRGHGEGGGVARQAPASRRCVVALVDAHRVRVEGNDVAVLQLPVDVVQGGGEGAEFQAGEGQDGPGTERREGHRCAEGRYGDRQEHPEIGAPGGGMVGRGDDDQTVFRAVAADQPCSAPSTPLVPVARVNPVAPAIPATTGRCAVWREMPRSVHREDGDAAPLCFTPLWPGADVWG
jgi:hypothetical protein